VKGGGVSKKGRGNMAFTAGPGGLLQRAMGGAGLVIKGAAQGGSEKAMTMATAVAVAKRGGAAGAASAPPLSKRARKVDRAPPKRVRGQGAIVSQMGGLASTAGWTDALLWLCRGRTRRREKNWRRKKRQCRSQLDRRRRHRGRLQHRERLQRVGQQNWRRKRRGRKVRKVEGMG